MRAVRYAARPTEQREDREVKATKIGAWSTSLTATFRTDPEVLASVLPPPLEPPTEPVVKVGISRVDLGRGLPPFGAGTFAVAARHGDRDGFYPLLMPMTTEQAVVGGRETFGEPKKLAEVGLDVRGDSVVGTVARMGVTIIEITGTLGAELVPPVDGERMDFYLKFLRSPDGRGVRRRPVARLLHTRDRDARRIAV